MSKILTAIFMTALVVGVVIWVFNTNISPGAGAKATKIQTDITTTCVNQTGPNAGSVVIGSGCN